MNRFAFLLIGIWVVFCIPFVVAILRRARRVEARPSQLRIAAESLTGMRLSEPGENDEETESIVDRHLEGSLFLERIRDQGRVTQVLSGSAGDWDVHVFDVCHKPVGRRNLPRYQTGALVVARDRPFPLAFVIPESSFSEPSVVAEGLSLVEVDLSPWPVLARDRSLFAEDQARAERILAKGLAVLLERDVPPPTMVEALGDRVLLYEEDRAVAPEQLGPFRDLAIRIARALESR